MNILISVIYKSFPGVHHAMLPYFGFWVTIIRKIRASVFWVNVLVPSRAVGVKRFWHGRGREGEAGKRGEGKGGWKEGGSQEILCASFPSRRAE